MYMPKSFFKVIVALAAVFALGLAAAPSQAAKTTNDISMAVMEGYQGGKNIDELVAEAFATAKAEGIPYYQMIAAVSETLVEMETRSGKDPMQVLDDVSAAIINKVCEYGLDRAETMRVMSQMILGVRAASMRHNVDQNLVKARVNNAMNGASCALQYAMAVVDPSFQEEVLYTYTAPEQFFGTTAPPGVPQVNSYDPRMDHTIIPKGTTEPETNDTDDNPSETVS
jgi:hypothetical protein